MNPRLAAQLLKNMGVRYGTYRIRHELEKTSGLLKRRHPVNPEYRELISLTDLRDSCLEFVTKPKEQLSFEKDRNLDLEAKAKRILSGEICFFSYEWKKLGKDYDWVTNPDSKYKYNTAKHWSEIQDFSREAGDIKYVWEKSRFSYLLTLIRYDYHFDVDLSEFVFSEIESWIDANPINQGPNWRCSQEISLRVFNWCFALHYYKNSPALTEDRWLKIQNVIYWSLHHVYHHIDFSRIAVRNNHAISETLCLTLSNILFPFIPETEKWAEKGKRWFEQEIDYQIYEDGTFLQFSMNYHRVVIQLLSFGISVANLKNLTFSKVVYDKAYKSLNFLYQCLQEENGWLPNYGSNDGALFFPLSDTDFRDYRPQLNTLHKLLTGQSLYSQPEIEEDSKWITLNGKNSQYLPLQKQFGCLSFEDGGFYLLREPDSFILIRCGNHKDRPAQADNLHVDVWEKGVNVLRDSGTYKYNTDEKLTNYFTGSASHNTVVVNDQSQMLKGGRFIWYYWTQAKSAKWREENDRFIFEGEIKAFTYLNSKATHFRKLIKLKNEKKWIIEDTISNLDEFPKHQVWHYENNKITLHAEENKIALKGKCKESYNSNYYGQISEGKASAFSFKNKIITKIALKN